MVRGTFPRRTAGYFNQVNVDCDPRRCIVLACNLPLKNISLRLNMNRVMPPVFVGLLPPTHFMDTLMEKALMGCPKDVSFPTSEGCQTEYDMYAPIVSPSVLLLISDLS